MAASLTIEGPELRSPVLAVLAAGWPVLRGEGGGGAACLDAENLDEADES